MGSNVRIDGPVSIDESCVIGNNVFIGSFTKIRSRVKIGDNSVIGHLVVIERDTIIGKFTVIQSQCHITANARIGDKVYFGPSVTIINEHKISSHRRGLKQILKGPLIDDGCRIGAKSLIMPGVIIGRNAEVGAGSVVTKDVRDEEIWFNPKVQAYCVGKVEKNEIIAF